MLTEEPNYKVETQINGTAQMINPDILLKTEITPAFSFLRM